MPDLGVVNIGVGTDAEAAAGDGSAISLLKRLRTLLVGDNAIEQGDLAFVWANSAAVNTRVTSGVLAVPAFPNKSARYAIAVYNPSTVTALTLSVRNRETLNAAVRSLEVFQQAAAVPAFVAGTNQREGKVLIVEGAMLGESCEIVLSNDTVLGVADGFTARVRIRKL